jgi:1,4-alpha-glucan branching enzyme
MPRLKYRVVLPKAGLWREILNSDSELYGGSNLGNLGGVFSEDYAVHGQPFSALLTLPPMSVSAFRLE